MQMQSEFSKMQYLLIGNRFSGANLSKTRFDFDFDFEKRRFKLYLTLAVTGIPFCLL